MNSEIEGIEERIMINDPLTALVIPIPANETEAGIPSPPKPAFSRMEITGTLLMYLLIALSTMGGLSGAGSNIPLMLIFFNMTMREAVPLSAVVGICSTVLRFVLNFKQKHPERPTRVAINYEVVELTMPLVFLGSFIGVKLGKTIGEVPRLLVFAVTVAWSIYTTARKAAALIK